MSELLAALETIEVLRRSEAALAARYIASQAEIEKLRTGLGTLLSVAPDTLGCGRNCSAEIDGDTEDEYAMCLRIARYVFSGSSVK